MHFARLFATAASVASVSAFTSPLKGYNYGATNADGSVRTQQQYEDLFNTAIGVTGAPGFNSARLYTMIQGGTTNSPIEAIPAAISTGTSLLLGLWASAGQANIDNEIAALQNAISQYGTAFTDLVVAISVGSEDLYRITTIGSALNQAGAEPADISSYIGQVKTAITGTAASGLLVGHVDTWQTWVNSSNAAVVSAADFIGMDAYPYYETTYGNDISNAVSLFNDAYSQTLGAAQGKPVWVTETGWPTTGPTEAQAVPSVANAETYWQGVGCGILFDKINVWWYTLEDPVATGFGVVGDTLTTTPLYDLTCSTSTLVNLSSSLPNPTSASASIPAAVSSGMIDPASASARA